MDDSTVASHPGKLMLDLNKLKVFQREFSFSDRLFRRWTIPYDALAEHLIYGCCNPAVVVQTTPELIVSAYSGDHDWVLLLRFPQFFVHQYSLKPKTLLLTVNTYSADEDWKFYMDYRKQTSMIQRAYQNDEIELVCDLEHGPDHLDNGWINFYPKIAEFVSNDYDMIHAHKQEVASNEEWRRTYELGFHLLSEGRIIPRNGNPYFSDLPVRPRYA
jgi:hypothetical protein